MVMKEFNLEEAKAGKPVCTRDGKPARILCFDLKNEHYKIAAAVFLSENTEYIETFTIDGRRYAECTKRNDSDLVMAPIKKQGWINVYKRADNENQVITTTQVVTSTYVFRTEELAKEAANSDNYIATVSFEWEE